MRRRQGTPSPEPSCVSPKSYGSLHPPLLFSNEPVTSDPSVDHCGEIRSTAELHKYACDLTLDPNTANTQLILSDGNRKITCVKDHQPYPDHPERFDVVPQVLCGESLTGLCYWEFEWSGYVNVSVSYKGIRRTGGRDCWFGFNDKSWSLYCSNIYCHGSQMHCFLLVACSVL